MPISSVLKETLASIPKQDSGWTFQCCCNCFFLLFHKATVPLPPLPEEVFWNFLKSLISIPSCSISLVIIVNGCHRSAPLSEKCSSSRFQCSWPAATFMGRLKSWPQSNTESYGQCCEVLQTIAVITLKKATVSCPLKLGSSQMFVILKIGSWF